MKKLFIVAMVAASLSVMGCASFATSNMLGPGNFFSDSVNVGEIRGEATSRVWLFFFGEESFPSVERVARENGITRIATVERYSRPGILGLWIDYTTIVTGQ